MTWKGFRWMQLCQDFKIYPGMCLEGLRKIMKNLGHDNWSTGQDLKPGCPEYKVRVLTTMFGMNMTSLLGYSTV
jgi:hypothetical protein